MSYVVAAARVLARAAAIHVEEAAAAAGPVAVARAREAYEQQAIANAAASTSPLEAPLETPYASSALAPQEQVEALHYPAPWPSAAPAAAPQSAALGVAQPAPPPPLAQSIPRPTPAPRAPPAPAHTVTAHPRPLKVYKAAPLPEAPVVVEVVREVQQATPAPSLSPALPAQPRVAPVETLSSPKVEPVVATPAPHVHVAEATGSTPVDDVEAAEPVSRLPAIDRDTDEAPVALRSSTVPSSRLGRLFHYGSLAASLGIGAATETVRRTAGGGGEGSVFMSDANVRRLVATLGRMRGAALKLGQFMSIQDNTILPPEIERVLHQVQAHANYMPDWQFEKAMKAELGDDWQHVYGEFDRIPVASASIGQVHRATLPDGTPVAVKVQFPGVAGSINSDLANLSILLRGSAVLPKGLYLQNTIAVMRRELEDECDYVREGAAGQRFHELLKDDPVFQVPVVIPEASTGKVLTTEWMSGRPLSKMRGMSQETRDLIGSNIMRLCLRELFEFRFMQTDPNWANFLFDAQTGKVQLIDFGASRAYTKEFMDGWYRLLSAALSGDREIMRIESQALGYLTGEEEEVMVNAHIDSMVALATPFQFQGKYPFATQTITDDVRALIPVMLKHRLTPPPAPTYSLNRKLSGAFLMCAKLGANVDCHALWRDVVGGYVEGPVAGEEAETEVLMAEAHA